MINTIDKLFAVLQRMSDRSKRADIKQMYKDGASFPNSEYSQEELNRLFPKPSQSDTYKRWDKDMHNDWEAAWTK
jgi:hypothetical protein